MGDGGLFSSEAFLMAFARAFLPGQQARIETVAVEGRRYRVLVAGKRVVDGVRGFHFFYEALGPEGGSPREVPFIGRTERAMVAYPPGPGDLDPGMRSPTVRFEGFATFEEYLRSRGQLHARSTVARIARNRRKLERVQEVVFRPSDSRPESLATLLRLKSARARAAGWYDICAKPALPRFLEALRDAGHLRYSTLAIDGEVAAVEALLLWPGRSYFKLGAYDPRFAAHGPGAMLIAENIRGAFADGVAECDLQLGLFDDKRTWATHVRLIGAAGAEPFADRLRARLTRPIGRTVARLRGRG